MSDDSPIPPSPLPSFEDEEPTLNGIEDMPKPMREWARSHSRRVRRVEKWGEPRGMLYELHTDWSAIKKFFAVFKWAAPMIASAAIACIVGIIWLVNHAATQPPQPTPEQLAKQVARELAKQKGTP